MDYRNTLNLPVTDFPMRANLPQREPEFWNLWDELNLYHTVRERRKDRETFVLHDGPPYANGAIHLGTGLNKILKDLVVKSKILLGMNVHYRPGWDCHGLPIELNVVQALTGEEAKTLASTEIRKRCHNFALKFVDKHRKTFKRLGVIGEWERPYLTLNPPYEAEELRQFGRLVERGYVYQGMKPVYWCPVFKTALAEAEVEYEEHTSPSIYVRFPMPESSHAKIKQLFGLPDGKPVQAVIWTTTPWTLPADRAVCLHPNYVYGLIPFEKEYVLIAKDLLGPFLKETELTPAGEILGNATGREIADLKVEALPPFGERPVPLILGTHVTLEAGTGCVHTAPGHGHEDYLVGMEYGLEVFSPVDEEGRFTNESPVCAGMKVDEANKPIIEDLESRGLLVHEDRVVHQYPYCWRSKKPIIFRATRQWFISLEKDNLRDRLLDAIDNQVQWIPAWGRQRIRGMVENRQEWCISRQRHWGVPIPAIYLRGSDEGILDGEFINQLAEVIQKEGTLFWYKAIGDPEMLSVLPRVRELLPEGMTLKDVRLEKDILDVWFDSGVSHHSVMAQEENLYPVDLYLEGSDQHRGWFQSSLVTAMSAGHEPPFRTVLTHGFTVDEDGRKLSKSRGNYVVLDDLIKEIGADVIRLWVAAEDFRGDVTFSKEILKRITESYRRIRNTARFLLSNLYDFTPAGTVPENDRPELDRWILNRWRECKRRILQSYKRYDFHRIFYELNNFCSVDLSALYLDIIKDRLYVSGKHSRERRAGQSTLAEIAVELTACTAPILSYTSEEIWQHLRKLNLVEAPSVFLHDLDLEIPESGKTLMETWDQVFLLRAEAIKAIEQARAAGVIGHSLESSVAIQTGDAKWQALLEAAVQNQKGDSLADVLIVSRVELGALPPDAAVYTSPVLPDTRMAVTKSPGYKCPRCWHYDEQAGPEEADLCPRCKEVLADPEIALA